MAKTTTPGVASSRRAPNILLVLADQWRGTDQGWRGNPDVLTPRLDQLAADGVAVHGAYANSPVCGPSRGSLLTGRFPHRHGVVANDLPLASGVPTVADALLDQGYRTGWIGKWHLDGVPRDKWVAPKDRRGFEYWAATNCSHQYFNAHYYTGDDPSPVAFEGYEPHVQTDLALRYLAESDSRPFFLTVAYGPPHDPYPDVPRDYLDRYDPATLSLRPNTTDEPAHREALHHYYAAISALDDQLGRLLDALDELGLRDDTLVVVTSDHGDMLYSHQRWAKQVPHEESISVPLVLSWPARLSAFEHHGLMGLVDLAPTLLGLVEAPALPDTDGLDLSEALIRNGPLREAVMLSIPVSLDEAFRQGVTEWRGVRTPTHTYARLVGGRPWILFDNDRDPYQQHNLLDTQAPPEWLDGLLDDLLSASNDVPAPGADTVRSLGLVDAWNARECELNPTSPRLL